jgi:predicted neutral ceramidase superfamily lipid hydrolase
MMKLFILFGNVINPHRSHLMQTFKAQLLVVKYINLKQSKFLNFVLFLIFNFVHCLVCVACVCLFNFLLVYFFLRFFGLCG